MSLLVVQHEAGCPPALLGRWLTDEGLELDVRHPYRGDDLPADLAAHDGLVVLGGHMGAYDDGRFPWLTATKALLRGAAAAGTPALGLCLGHQLAAVALGGVVARNPRGRMTGVYHVGWTAEAAADPLVGFLTSPRRGIQWNSDVVVRVPAGAVLLAATEAGEVQAMRFAPTVWGIQLHPEADIDIVRGWAASAPGPDDDRHLATIQQAQGELEESWRALGKSFAARVAR